MTELTACALRLPLSVQGAAKELCKADGKRLNQFVAIAVAEKAAALKSAAFFDESRQRDTGTAQLDLRVRSGGKAPREGDELIDGRGPMAVRSLTACKRAWSGSSATATLRAASKTAANAQAASAPITTRTARTG